MVERAVKRAARPDTPSIQEDSGGWSALASSAKMAAMGGTWLVGKPIEARKIGGPTRGGGVHTHIPWLCADAAGHSFSCLSVSALRWSAARSAHIAPGRTSMMPELLEGFLQRVLYVGAHWTFLSFGGDMCVQHIEFTTFYRSAARGCAKAKLV